MLDPFLEDASDMQCKCWGAMLSGSAAECDPNFDGGTGHLKNKFCNRCRHNGILMPASSIRALSPELYDLYENRTVGGAWNPGSPPYRLINQTANCSGPRLVIFAGGLPNPSHRFLDIPANWLTPDGQWMRLEASKGTLVPRDYSSEGGGFCASAGSKRMHAVIAEEVKEVARPPAAGMSDTMGSYDGEYPMRGYAPAHPPPPPMDMAFGGDGGSVSGTL